MTISLILDQSQSIDYAELPPGPLNRLANHELICWLDAACNPHTIHWPWGDRTYARSITMRGGFRKPRSVGGLGCKPFGAARKVRLGILAAN